VASRYKINSKRKLGNSKFDFHHAVALAKAGGVGVEKYPETSNRKLESRFAEVNGAM
jgi:hypothetical protein